MFAANLYICIHIKLVTFSNAPSPIGNDPEEDAVVVCRRRHPRRDHCR